MTKNPGKKANEEANEADHNSRHSQPLTAQDSRANHKTVWTVTEDEELFKKYSIRAVVQTELPDAVLWDELAARDPDLKELKSAIAREYFTMPERKALRPQFNPVFAELAVVGGLVLRGSRIVVTRQRKTKKTLRQSGAACFCGKSESYKDKGVSKNHGLVSRFGPDDGSQYSYCHPCQVVTPAYQHEPLPMSPLLSKPWKEVAIYFWGPINMGKYLLVIKIMQTLTVG